MRPVILSIAALAMASCSKCSPQPPSGAGHHSTVTVSNETDSDAVAYISFGSDSVIVPSSANWSFCTTTSSLTCNFKLNAHSTQPLPLGGQYLNATIAFNAGVGCGSTKAELNVNNPKWYDTLDVSLVDGYSNKIKITVLQGVPAAAAPATAQATAPATITLGPPLGKEGNSNVYGLFPFGCDICVDRQSPPCGITTGSDGCKTGTQYKPDVPCQYQGPIMGGGSIISVSLQP